MEYSKLADIVQADKLWIPPGEKRTVVYCHYCRRNISATCRIRCDDPACNGRPSAPTSNKEPTESTDPSEANPVGPNNAEVSPTETCIDCFCAGAALLPHRPDHPYRVVDCLDFPIFNKDWSAREELLLLEAIDRHGAGNWKTIAEYIGTKTLKQCEDHYWDSYLGSYGQCLPSTVVTDEKMIPTSSLLIEEERDAVQLGYTIVPPGETIGGTLNRDRNKDSTRGGKREMDIRDRIAQLPGADLSGFMPLRQDFEFEHENSAEIILADMEFSDSEHPSESALKLDVVKIYNQKLDERDRRKRFVIDTGLVDVKKIQQADRRRGKEDRDMATRCRMLSRFQSASEQETMLSGIMLARRLKKQLDLFVQYRQLGIRTLEEAREYEVRRRRREQELRLKKSKQGIDYLPAGSAELGNNPSVTSGRNKNNGFGNSNSSSSLNTLSLSKNSPGPSESEVVAAKRTIERNAPEAHVLSPDEIDICYRLNILPMHYLALQSVIVREAYRNGSLTKKAVSELVNMEEPAQSVLCDFFVRALGDGFPNMPVEEGSLAGSKRAREEQA